MAELRRLWLGINDTTAPEVLERVPAMQVQAPTPMDTVAGGRVGVENCGR